MNKFLNTNKRDVITSLVDGLKDRLKNPYYINMDQKPTVTTYYNTNIKVSTLDEGSKTTYANLGDNSSIKYNKINGMFIYGIGNIRVSLDNGEFGLESESIEGEGTILPNTIIPYPNDYFSIRYIEKDFLFKIESVSFDTIENGSNLYKVQYKLDQITDDHIEKQVVETYEFLVDNIGTTFNPIVRIADFSAIQILENTSAHLSKYYKTLFFNTRVQAFTFYDNTNYFYDPFLIEFLIRNKVLDRDDEYLYITHQTIIPATFSIDYDKTFFRYLEINDKNKFTPKITSQAKFIDNPLSVLSSRIEDYFEIMYSYPINTVRSTIYNIDPDLFNRIKTNQKYTAFDGYMYRNIIIKYFNNENITTDDLKFLDDVDYSSNMELFYNIPIVIYILNVETERLLVKNQDID